MWREEEVNVFLKLQPVIDSEIESSKFSSTFLQSPGKKNEWRVKKKGEEEGKEEEEEEENDGLHNSDQLKKKAHNS